MTRAALAFAFSLWPMLATDIGHALAQEIFSVEIGGTRKISGSDLEIRVIGIQDFTALGCQGGPRGCADQVQVVVSGPTDSSEVTLIRPQTIAQGQPVGAGVLALGFRFKLLSIDAHRATLSVAPSGRTLKN